MKSNSSTQDRVEGHGKDLKGKIKEGAGKVVATPSSAAKAAPIRRKARSSAKPAR